MLHRRPFKAAFAAQFVLAAYAQTYNFQLLECGQLTAFPNSVNNSGVIVGAAHTINSQVNSGFVYAKGNCTSTDFGGIGADFSGVTNSDALLGQYAYQGQNTDFELKGGKLTNLPKYPDSYTSYIGWKNASGLYAGNFTTDPLDDHYSTGFVYRNGKFKALPQPVVNGLPLYFTLSGLNDQNIIVGTFYGFSTVGFVLQNGNLDYIAYPGATYTFLNGINNNDLAVGTYSSSKASGVFTYDLTSKTFTDLMFPLEYAACHPVGITDSGVIAALYSPSGGLLIATPTGK